MSTVDWLVLLISVLVGSMATVAITTYFENHKKDKEKKDE